MKELKTPIKFNHKGKYRDISTLELILDELYTKKAKILNKLKTLEQDETLTLTEDEDTISFILGKRASHLNQST